MAYLVVNKNEQYELHETKPVLIADVWVSNGNIVQISESSLATWLQDRNHTDNPVEI